MFLAQTFVFIVGLLVSEDNGFNPFKLATASPVRLIKNAVDLSVNDRVVIESNGRIVVVGFRGVLSETAEL